MTDEKNPGTAPLKTSLGLLSAEVATTAAIIAVLLSEKQLLVTA